MQEIKERIRDLRTVYPEKSVSYLNLCNNFANIKKTSATDPQYPLL